MKMRNSLAIVALLLCLLWDEDGIWNGRRRPFIYHREDVCLCLPVSVSSMGARVCVSLPGSAGGCGWSVSVRECLHTIYGPSYGCSNKHLHTLAPPDSAPMRRSPRVFLGRRGAAGLRCPGRRVSSPTNQGAC